MRTLLPLLSLTLLLALLTACGDPAPQDGDGGAAGTAGDATATSGDATAMRLEVPADPEVGTTTLRVYLLEENEAVEGADVEITGTMTHAGMVPVIEAAEESEPGLYVADGFDFTMAGDWILTADATLPDGDTLREEATVTVRQP